MKKYVIQKTKLEHQSNEIYNILENLEKQEKLLLIEGKNANSKSRQRHLAVRLSEIRKEHKRYSTRVEIINRNIDILSLAIHNNNLISENKEAVVQSKELNDVANKADDVLSKLKDDYYLVEAMDSSDQLISGEELDILDEFEKKIDFDELEPIVTEEEEEDLPQHNRQYE